MLWTGCDRWIASPSSAATARPAGRRHLVQDEKQRQLRGGRGIQSGDGGFQELVGGLGQGVLVQPLRPAELIPLVRLGRFPRGFQRNRLAHLSQLKKDRTDVCDRPRAHRQWNRARVAVRLAVDVHHRVAIDVLLIARHPELVHQCIDPILARSDPGATAIDPRPVIAHLRERATAHPVTSLEQRHRVTRLFQPQSGGQSRESRTYNAIIHVGHEPPLWFICARPLAARRNAGRALESRGCEIAFQLIGVRVIAVYVNNLNPGRVPGCAPGGTGAGPLRSRGRSTLSRESDDRTCGRTQQQRPRGKPWMLRLRRWGRSR